MIRPSLLPAGVLLVLLVLPVVGLALGTGPTEVAAALALPETQAALRLSAWTSLAALAAVIASGTPLAWWLSRGRGRGRAWVRALVELPVVLPPAVLGVALLETFGRRGMLGGLGLSLPFTSGAVVLAQVLVGAPLFVLTAAAAFRAVDDDVLLVARTLGASRRGAWLSVALPAAAPGLASAAALAWARGVGEFGATLLFAGNLPGRTQTLPLAIYGALERDLAQARALSVLLVLAAIAVLAGVQLSRTGGRRAR